MSLLNNIDYIDSSHAHVPAVVVRVVSVVPVELDAALVAVAVAKSNINNIYSLLMYA